jgi:hypothetical protein
MSLTPVQLMAYRLAVQCGHDVSPPRTLAKSVMVARGRCQFSVPRSFPQPGKTHSYLDGLLRTARRIAPAEDSRSRRNRSAEEFIVSQISQQGRY